MRAVHKFVFFFAASRRLLLNCLLSHHSFRLRKEKLEENQIESEKQRSSQNASPTNESPVLNLSKNKRDRSHSPEYDQTVGSPEPEHNSLDVDDASDMEVSESSLHSQSPASPPNLNTKLNFHQRDFPRPPPSIAFPSTEILLRNIQELLKVVLENSIQHEQQISFEKGESDCETSREMIKAMRQLHSLACLFVLVPPLDNHLHKCNK
jgi:hypothetical protein